jgi:hypothetical protein
MREFRLLAGVILGVVLLSGPVVGSASRAAERSSRISLGRSIGGVTLRQTPRVVSRYLGEQGRRDTTKTSAAVGAFDIYYSRARLRVTYDPCTRGACVVAVATASPIYRTLDGLHVGGSGLRIFNHVGLGLRCGALHGKGYNAFCTLGFSDPAPARPRSGTAFLERLPSNRVDPIVTTIAVGEAQTRWNLR